ncbi:peptidyl-prolyl cis-trans isomerase CYP59-like [Euphorbia lathyris]|uniref:peptidyl-prolyl cis-trans isomerase CYP59-like n=1 Tax=Euphorbia lathyris TaxID=212925 RepID=UPI003313353B
MSVLIVTSLGDIVVDLFTEKCPLTCKNFLKLCKIKYYNGSLFHTVQKDFTAQTGDPTGTGAAGDSIYKFLYGEQARFFNDEIHLDLKHVKTGTLAMASGGENLNASQFYFTLRDDLDYLDGKHTVFGEVAEGLETLTRINEAYVDPKNRPYKNIRIKHTYILDDPYDDPPQLADLVPNASPEGKPKDEVDDEVRLEDDWVPMDEQLSIGELEEVIRAKEAHSSAVVLESIGDIPDAEIKPPENVLFVCKLNPVTEDEDLHTIFSRFGTVVAADIIRDFKTGDSLCYAFIEFDNVEACEQAYFKMDNALIDDRRIHVDFSQSVSKQWSEFRRHKNSQMGKGRGCFKCGALDHIAKDCTGDPTANQLQPSKYVIKDDNMQRGGNDNSRYEMVFDGETPAPESPRERKRNGHQDQQRKDSGDKHDRNRGQREDHERRTEERVDRRREQRDDDRRESRDYRKRSSENEGRGNERENNEGYRKRTTTDDDSHKGEPRADTSYKKRYTDSERRERRDEPSNRKYEHDRDDKRERRDEPSKRNYEHDRDDRRDRRDEPSNRKYEHDRDDRRDQRDEPSNRKYEHDRDDRRDRRDDRSNRNYEQDRDRRHRNDRRR